MKSTARARGRAAMAETGPAERSPWFASPTVAVAALVAAFWAAGVVNVVVRAAAARRARPTA